MVDFLSFALGSFAALFPVADPLGAIPVFLALSAGFPPKIRETMSLRISIYVVIVLVVFLLLGGSVLNFFGISIAVVKIAGGIVIFEAGWETLNQQPKLKDEDEKAAVARSEHKEDISFIPMTIPMLAGPGSIAVTLGLAAQAGQDFSVKTGLNFLAITLAIILMGLLVYVSLRLSSWFLDLLGETGITAISRLLGLFILAVGVQLILNGFADWLIHINEGEQVNAFLRPYINLN